LCLQVTYDGGERGGGVRRNEDESGTGAPPVRRNAWKRAGGILDRLRLGEHKGVEPLLLHQPGRAVPVEKSRHRFGLTSWPGCSRSRRPTDPERSLASWRGPPAARWTGT